MRKIVVIPARLESSRLAGKVLLELGGVSILHRVYNQCLRAMGIDAVYIATDNQKIVNHCKSFTDNVITTSSSHNSGTDRIAEAVNSLECDIVINVQGDEPFIDPDLISDIADEVENSKMPMSSAMQRIDNVSDLNNPNVVKVVVNSDNQAIYFSRSAIPYLRDDWKELIQQEKIPQNHSFYRHIGIYGYEKDFLLRYSQMSAGVLENIEKLEQLRVLENGYGIQMIETTHDLFGIDTLKDYNKALKRIKND